MKTIYKSTLTYSTSNGEDSVQFVGTLSDNLSKINNALNGIGLVQASSTHCPLRLNVTEQFESIFNNK